MYSVEIEVFECGNPKIKGFLVRVGCKYYKYLNKEAMMQDLSSYYDFPRDAERMMFEMDDYIRSKEKKCEAEPAGEPSLERGEPVPTPDTGCCCGGSST